MSRNLTNRDPCCPVFWVRQFDALFIFYQAYTDDSPPSSALFGAALVANSAGTVVDISTEETRALVLSLWSIAPLNGPVTGPVIGGFVYQYLGWRWDNWLILILAGAATICMVFTKETYAPVLLKAKAARLRKETGDDRWWTRYDLNISPLALIKLNLTRPFVLFATEPILWFFNLW